MSENVIIDLFDTNLPGSIVGKGFVQEALKDKLKKDILATVNTFVDSPKPNSELLNGGISEADRQVFFIDGTRGAGKTTFLNGMVKAFNDEATGTHSQRSIHALRCIDPTKLPGFEPVLITVIAQLNAEVTNKLRAIESDVRSCNK